MGMFNWVNFKMPCPRCGSMVDNFQTKDGELTMREVDAFSVCNFYCACDKCDMWIEFNRKESMPTEGSVPKRTLDEVLEKYTMEERKDW